LQLEQAGALPVMANQKKSSLSKKFSLGDQESVDVLNKGGLLPPPQHCSLVTSTFSSLLHCPLTFVSQQMPPRPANQTKENQRREFLLFLEFQLIRNYEKNCKSVERI
jgi:hypothetical protein